MKHILINIFLLLIALDLSFTEEMPSPYRSYLTTHDSAFIFGTTKDENAILIGTYCSVWDVQTGELIKEYNVGSSSSVAFSQNYELMATANRNGIIKVWDFETGKNLFTFHHVHPFGENYTFGLPLLMKFRNNNNELISYGGDTRVVWNLVQGNKKEEKDRDNVPFTIMAKNGTEYELKDNKLIDMNNKQNTLTFDTSSFHIPDYSRWVIVREYRENETASSSDTILHVYDINNLMKTGTYNLGENVPALRVDISPDGKYFLFATHEQDVLCQIIDSENFKVHGKFDVPKDRDLRMLRFSQKGTYIRGMERLKGGFLWKVDDLLSNVEGYKNY